MERSQQIVFRQLVVEERIFQQYLFNNDRVIDISEIQIEKQFNQIKEYFRDEEQDYILSQLIKKLFKYVNIYKCIQMQIKYVILICIMYSQFNKIKQIKIFIYFMNNKNISISYIMNNDPPKLYKYNKPILPVIDRVTSYKKYPYALHGQCQPQVFDPEAQVTLNAFNKIATEKQSNQFLRLKSLGDHQRSRSTIIKYPKPKRKLDEDKQKVERIKQCCIPTVGLLNDDSSSVDSELQQNQEQCDDKIMTYSTSKNVYMLKSVYVGRPSTVFFYYCEQTHQEKQKNQRIYLLQQKQKQQYKLMFKFPSDKPFKCVVNPLKYAGFEQTQELDWVVFWGMPRRKIIKKLNKYQKINHFPGCWELGRKDNLWKNLWSVKKKFKEQYSFVPNTYILPYDLEKFQRRKEEVTKKHLWIMKPVASACGRGVRMVNKKSKIYKKHNYLVCEYIANPFLINGLKFDLRLYVLVSSYDPLRIYLFDQGLTRFATEKYSTNISELTKKYIHLTNYSVNKYAPKFVKNKNSENDGEGSKWSITALKKYLKENNYDVDKLFDQVQDIIIKTCIATEPHMLDLSAKTYDHRNNCFQVYGFDVLIDQTLKPWLLEVNVCPSLSSTSPLDLKIKHTLLTDTFNLIGIRPIIKQNLQSTRVKSIFSRNIKQLADLDHTNCLDKLSAQDWNILFQTDQQYYRRGHFKRIFPNKENVNNYQKFFEFQRYNNIMIAKWLCDSENFLTKISQKKWGTNIN